MDIRVASSTEIFKYFIKFIVGSSFFMIKGNPGIVGTEIA